MKKYTGEQLMLLRSKKKLSQGGVAKNIGISQPTYSRWEAKTEIAAEKVAMVLKAMNATWDDLDKWGGENKLF